MSELTEFLLARIAEDEELANNAALSAGGVGYGEERIANGKTWSSNYHEVVRPVVPDVSDRRTLADCGGFVGLDIAPHVARHDPARVLRECEAKRRIVKVARFAPAGADGWGFRRILKDLASVYADHEDYRDEWKP